jgi:hypothetical protein
MPIRYAIHRDLSVVVTRFTGHVTDEEFIDSYRRMLQDPDYTPGTNELADLRGVTDLNLSAAALRRVEALTEARYEGSGADFRTAILAPRDQSYGIGRMYEVFAEDGPEHVRVCREVADALAWLHLEDNALEL